METEIRLYYSSDSKLAIINYLNTFTELNYKGKFYECTDQYNHPMKEYDFYSKNIDGRFRVRKVVGNNESKCMIIWRRRIKDYVKELIYKKEETVLNINPKEYDKLCLILESVLHLELVESYERNREIYFNDDIELVVDEYPFGLCLEIKNRRPTKDAEAVVKEWLDKLKFNPKDVSELSWEDKYVELCKEQNIKVESIVRFNTEMPKIITKFNN